MAAKHRAFPGLVRAQAILNNDLLRRSNTLAGSVGVI